MKCTSVKDPNIIKPTLLVDTKEGFKVYESKTKETKINIMEKAQKKPVIVEFIQLKEDNILKVYTEINGKPNLKHPIAEDKWYDYEDIVKKEGLKLKTPESGGETQIASIGDYIVFGFTKELGRHCWPVKPSYFENAYIKL